EMLKDPAKYETFTCLVPGSKLEESRVERGSDGKPRYGWKRGTPAIDQHRQAKLVQNGLLKREETLVHLQDADTGKTVLGHAGSVSWNAYRGRWILIAVETYGRSFLGEVWYAEADTPIGPWVYARRVVTHKKYSFYNPMQHPYFAKQNGRVVFFEGTYANTY